MRWSDSTPLALMLAAALGIGWVRPGLAAGYSAVKRVDDVYALPSPEQAVGLSLGYRSALADLVYTSTLIEYGIHTQERRRFEFVANYLDTTIALDPTLREVYYFADTLLVLQSQRATLADYQKAREIMLRGLEQFPYDTELWVVTGQFLAYLAPGGIEDADMRAEWREAGARVLGRACELGAGDRTIMRKTCFGAARTLTAAGEREAVIRYLERVIALSEDEHLRAYAQAWLEQKLGEHVRDELTSRHQRLAEVQRADLPFVTPGLYLLLGPPFDPARCAGLEPPPDRCATRWPDWAGAASGTEP